MLIRYIILTKDICPMYFGGDTYGDKKYLKRCENKR